MTRRRIGRQDLLAGILLLAIAPSLSAQGTRSDYERAKNLPKRVRNTVIRTRVRPHWFAGNTRLWYRNDLGGGRREFIVVDASAGTRRPVFDHARLAAALAKASGKPVASDRLPFDSIVLSPDAKTAWFKALGRDWRCTLSETTIVREAPPPAPKEEKKEKKDPKRRRSRGHSGTRSPDGKWTTFTRDHNLYLRSNETKKEQALTSNGTDKNAYGAGVDWSPDSKKFVARRSKKGFERKVYLVESSPKDQLQPKLQSYSYRKPGDDIPQVRPHLFDVESAKEIPVDDALFSNPWKLDRIRWDRDGSRFTFFVNQRGHQAVRIIAVDAATGKTRAIVNEESVTFIDYAHKTFFERLEETGEILWASERDGWNHLYLYDAKTGKVKNRVTKGRWVVRGVDRVDAEARQVWFRAGGIHPGQDPYHVHYCRVNFDGTGLVRLTDGDGTHRIEYSPDRRTLLDTWSRVDQPPVTELRRVSDGRKMCELERGDWTKLLETGWQVPERFVSKGRDGKTDIHGVIWRPTTFDAKRSYPVIERIYAGPHGAFVPKTFREFYSAQSLAELGFIVVQIDGMGTSYRSKAFHDVCWKNLGDSGFPDRIPWIRAAAKKHPYMDVSRVGIYGGSAGGQSSTRAMLAHGDFYKVAVSHCGCHDNRMDKIWWNEAWMGWPVGPHYEEQSNVTQAHRLEGKLLLIVGELDRNVDPASTMQVVNALIKANKDFEMLVIPGAGHGDGGAYGIRRRRDFFVRHLLGVEPRSAP